jgi:hypothetical protein
MGWERKLLSCTFKGLIRAWLRPLFFRPVLLDDQRALAQPKALLGPLLNGSFEGRAGQREIVSIDEDMTDFAMRPHSFDAVRIVSGRHCPILLPASVRSRRAISQCRTCPFGSALKWKSHLALSLVAHSKHCGEEETSRGPGEKPKE